MRKFAKQLTELTMVSNALQAALAEYRSNKDEVGEREMEGAMTALNKVIRFLSAEGKEE